MRKTATATSDKDKPQDAPSPRPVVDTPACGLCGAKLKPGGEGRTITSMRAEAGGNATLKDLATPMHLCAPCAAMARISPVVHILTLEE